MSGAALRPSPANECFCLARLGFLSKPPAGRFADEAVVAEAVVALARKDVEQQPTMQLGQILAHMTAGAFVAYEVGLFPDSCRRPGHRGAPAGPLRTRTCVARFHTIKPADAEDAMVLAHGIQPRWR